ncbi:myelin-associated glycoprotein-like isoform X2 [Hypomesus transpacificus]|uniref:myelin-associated glycoprotein-like isoform X2 n=1 Tax=Hypomesus transpacificus TaxID=137520 RepID=UPI001F07562F|nr:myelin-associated glycoprotein-like isoform X2 [Hypomesus transpacificus]XP_046895899.1 myelin-associated glycoprotein-like isoform X2 [Hypomesus transpacificus]XP_046895908.1 myelin-associated glycoprotein-like isoform X2 [Hypomesus transpacificus]
MRTISVGSRDRQDLWILVLLLLTGVWGDEGWEVKYPASFCGIKGSTVTIPCRYKYPEKYHPVRVIWCITHTICQGTTPKFYDSNFTTNHPGFKYIGDKKNNCTLQIENINTTDSKTYRFRFETDPKNAHTGQSGVHIEVREIDNNITLEVTASDDRASKEGVTLSCTSSSPCIFNNPKITWYQNNTILQARGPTLTLSRVSLSDAGNYSCGIESSPFSRSDAYSLQVEDIPKTLTAPVMLAVRLTVLAIATAVTIIIVRRLKAKYPNKENRDSVDTPPADPIYINMRETNPSPKGESRQDVNTVK